MNQHPDLFSENRIEADPPVNAFLPRVAYNRDNVTVELLENLGHNQSLFTLFRVSCNTLQ